MYIMGATIAIRKQSVWMRRMSQLFPKKYTGPEKRAVRRFNQLHRTWDFMTKYQRIEMAYAATWHPVSTMSMAAIWSPMK
mmetsp:Transcript_52204/g.87047  ORF Transcript_52204/g.87047 Transcript_52204/m.87047 type:complete len:80 (-) Transcript_52204:139-378(-)